MRANFLELRLPRIHRYLRERAVQLIRRKFGRFLSLVARYEEIRQAFQLGIVNLENQIGFFEVKLAPHVSITPHDGLLAIWPDDFLVFDQRRGDRLQYLVVGIRSGALGI